ncbi:hypothetical protein [Streptomyces sp. NPDC006285]|uniref:hypothetical protein n=1 Tax=Streptomyces sp. NPDC006285 TaxID=3364742 RepID=UPI00368ABE78
MNAASTPPDPGEPHRKDGTLERLEALREHSDPFVRSYLDRMIPSVEALTEGMAGIAATLQQPPEEAYRQAIEDQYLSAYRYTPDPPPDSAHQMWIRSHEATDWEPLGYTTDPILGLDYGAPDPYESAVLAWPHRHGKTAFTFELSAPFTSSMRGLFDALDASYQADLDRRLVRLADDLGQFEPHVRHDFNAVQRVLEDAGVLDGYGRVTIPQPVRPPVEPPTVPPLMRAYPNRFGHTYPLDHLYAALTDPPGTTRPLIMRSVPRHWPSPSR